MLALVWILFIVLAVWFLMLRPQRKRMQEHQSLVESLEVGHEIVSAGGIHGRIESLEGDVVRVEIAPGTVIRLARRAVARNVTVELRAASDDAEPADEAADEG